MQIRHMNQIITCSLKKILSKPNAIKKLFSTSKRKENQSKIIQKWGMTCAGTLIIHPTWAETKNWCFFFSFSVYGERKNNRGQMKMSEQRLAGGGEKRTLAFSEAQALFMSGTSLWFSRKTSMSRATVHPSVCPSHRPCRAAVAWIQALFLPSALVFNAWVASRRTEPLTDTKGKHGINI